MGFETKVLKIVDGFFEAPRVAYFANETLWVSKSQCTPREMSQLQSILDQVMEGGTIVSSVGDEWAVDFV